MDARQPIVLFTAAKWWSLSARLAIVMVRAGCRVSALCPAAHPLTYVSGIDLIRRYRGMHSMECLREAMHVVRPDLIVPCDDGVVMQLHALHREEPSLRALIERSLGPSESFPVVSSRYQLLATGARLGISVPTTYRVTCEQDLISWHETASRAVVKTVGESGGNGVRICRSLDESMVAWEEFRTKQSWFTAWKRLAIDRDPLALWTRRQPDAREITVQRFIAGRPANLMMACREGEVLAQVSVLVVVADGPTGAASVVRRVCNEKMLRAARLLASELRLSGFFGLDFILESQTSEPYLIEMNPRCTQLGHLEFADQGSLASALIEAWRQRSMAPLASPSIEERTVALFPAALAANGTLDDLIAASYHDVPLGEPRLVQELLLKPWPQRRLAARIYHLLRPVRASQTLHFDAPAPTLGEAARSSTPGIA